MSKILSDNVLVLNKHYLAVQVCNAQKAITILCKGHCRVIDDQWKQYDFNAWVKRSQEICRLQEELSKYTGEIRSPNLFVYSPQVIYLHHTETEIRELGAVKFSRKSVFERDNFTCQYCGARCNKTMATLEHVIPKSRGGESSFSNIVTACKLCNNWKANKTPEEAGMNLIRKPTVPRWKSFIGLPFSKVKRDYWQQFIK